MNTRTLRWRVARIAETNPFPLLLVCVTGILLLVVFAPALIVGDTWLTLVAGREVVEHGLPSTDQITFLSRGGTWTDQQWLAQVIFYGVNGVGGLRAVVLVDVLLVLLTLVIAIATARTNGATGRSTFIVGLLGVLAGPWGWTIRAQAVALPLFAAALWLLVDGSRRGLRRRTLFVLPLLVVWANVHGSVVLGAGLAVVLGASELVRRRSPAWLALALVVGAPLCVLASPYATKLPAYYHLMLIDAPFADMLREWQWSSPVGTTIVFYLLALLAVVLVAVGRSRSRLTLFEWFTLAVLLVGAVDAIRGVIWFALATMAVLPPALDGLIGRPDPIAPKVNRVIAMAAVGSLALAFVVALALPASWFLRDWPERQIRAVGSATRDPEVRVVATDRTADWLLWRLPSLRGRMAFDVRFELYDRRTLGQIVNYNGERREGWQDVIARPSLLVLDETAGRSHLAAVLAEPGARLVWRDNGLALVERLPAR